MQLLAMLQQFKGPDLNYESSKVENNDSSLCKLPSDILTQPDLLFAPKLRVEPLVNSLLTVLIYQASPGLSFCHIE